MSSKGSPRSKRRAFKFDIPEDMYALVRRYCRKTKQTMNEFFQRLVEEDVAKRDQDIRRRQKNGDS